MRPRVLALATALAAYAAPVQSQSNACLGYHPSVGYFNLCTPEGARLKRRLDRGTYSGGGTNPCLRYAPGRGYFYDCRDELYAPQATDPCLRYAPGRGYYHRC